MPRERVTGDAVLEAFAATFVLPNFRARFLLEARKKTASLHARICHRIETVFPASLRGRHITMPPAESCLVFLGGPARRSTWEAASRHLGRGDGVLIIAASGACFAAVTEAGRGCPAEIYSGTIA